MTPRLPPFLIALAKLEKAMADNPQLFAGRNIHDHGQPPRDPTFGLVKKEAAE